MLTEIEYYFIIKYSFYLRQLGIGLGIGWTFDCIESLILDDKVTFESTLLHFFLILSNLPILHLLSSFLQLLKPQLLPSLYFVLKLLIALEIRLLQRFSREWVSLVVEQMPLDIDSVDHVLRAWQFDRVAHQLNRWSFTVLMSWQRYFSGISP